MRNEPEIETAAAEISKDEFLAMARRSSEEIKALRAQIAFLAPKAQAYESIVLILGLLPQRGQVMGEDLAHVLDRLVEALAREVEQEGREQPKKNPAEAG